MTSTPQSGVSQPAKWKEPLLWAILVAVLLHLAVNVFFGDTLWHRMGKVETELEHVEHQLGIRSGAQ